MFRFYSKTLFLVAKVNPIQVAIGRNCALLRPQSLLPVISADSVSLCRQASSGSSWKRKWRTREEKKKIVFQYAGQNEKRAPRVYTWGNALTGSLGVKSFLKPEKGQPVRKEEHKPYRQEFFDEHALKWIDVDCGYGFTVYAVSTKTGHKVLGTGINSESQLGYHEYPVNSGRILDQIIQPAYINLPFNNPESSKILKVACGRAHTYVLTSEGMFSFGSNAYGQCGRNIVEGEIYRGNMLINSVPLEKNVTHITCGQDHTIFLAENGQVFSCGLSADGQTGAGHYDWVGVPSPVQGDIQGENIIHISGFSDTVLAVSDKGDLFGWGNSEYDQLAFVTENTQINTSKHLNFKNVGNVIKACTGGTICAVLNEQGQVFVWGFGILGKGPNLQSSAVPSLIPETLFGQNDFNPDSKVVDIACGMSHFAAITNQGDLYVWGKNKGHCLGLGHANDQYFPFKVCMPAEVQKISCGVDHNVALCRAFV